MKTSDRRLLRLLLLAALLLFSCVAATGQNSAAIDELVSLGIENYGLENYKAAYNLFSQAMKIDPNHPEASKWFWQMKAEHDVKNLRDKGSAAAESSGVTTTAATGAGAAAGAAGAVGVRYVYSETEQQALLGHLKNLDERLAMLSGQIMADSSVDKADMDGRLLAISRDLADLSTELHTIDVRDDLNRQLAAIARDVETLKDRDVGQQEADMSTVLEEVRRIDVDRDVSRNLTILSRGLEQRLTELQERIQELGETQDSPGFNAQLSLIGSELSRLAEEQARAAEEAAKRREALRLRAPYNPLLLALAASVIIAILLLSLLLMRQARYQRRATYTLPHARSLDDLLTTADVSSFPASTRPPRDWPNLSEVPASRRENVIRQLTELVSRDEDLRSRLVQSLAPARSTEGRSSSRVTRKSRRERTG